MMSAVLLSEDVAYNSQYGTKEEQIQVRRCISKTKTFYPYQPVSL
jgi:hypothetical protein